MKTVMTANVRLPLILIVILFTIKEITIKCVGMECGVKNTFRIWSAPKSTLFQTF